MGGTAWNRAKERARKAIRKVAVDLVKLYAERHKAPGFAYPDDGPWQNELEDSFPYEPTPDQIKAIAEVQFTRHLNLPSLIWSHMMAGCRLHRLSNSRLPNRCRSLALSMRLAKRWIRAGFAISPYLSTNARLSCP
jgi:hypothetical protein